MGLTGQAKIGKKYALYLPRVMVRALNLKEGEKVLLSVVGHALVMHTIEDPIKLALTGSKFASIKPETTERISIERQGSTVKSSH